MNAEIDTPATPTGSENEPAADEPAAQGIFPTREDALALALKIAGPKRHGEDAAPN